MPVGNLVQVRRGTEAQWSFVNPTLSSGEIGFETDTGVFKIGDGSTAWNALDPPPSDLSSTSGTLGVANGGTGLTSGGSDDDLLAWESSSGLPEWRSLSEHLDAALGSTKGMVLYRGVSSWAATPNWSWTTGYLLTWNETNERPEWTAPSGAASADVVLRDGTQALTSDWDAGSYQIRAETFRSDVAGTATPTGSAPLQVASTRMVDNLNVEFLDGVQKSYFLDISNMVSGTLHPERGGTGQPISLGSPGEALRVNGAGTNYEYFTPATATTTFDDDEFRVLLNTDATTKLAFDLSGVTGGNTRTLTVPDASGTIALTSDITASGDLLADGTIPLTADWDVGAYQIRALTFRSDVTTGTAPLTVASTTKVTNLNADYLDDQSGAYYLALSNATGSLDLTSQVTGALPVANGGTGGATASAARTALGLAIGTDVQAQDAELSAIAGLTSAADRVPYFTGSGTASLATFSSFGRSLVDDANAAAGRTTLGLGSIATQAASSVSITGGSVAGITDLAVADGGTGSSTASGARTNLGLAIGSDVQAYDADLAALAGLTSAANKVPYFTGSGTAAVADFSSFGRSLVDDASASAARTTLGLVIGTDVQAYSGDLATVAGLGTALQVLRTNAGGTALEWAAAGGTSDLTDVTGTLAVGDGGTGATTASGARTALGVAIGSDVQAWDADLDTYAANPLTSAELGELQNIGATTISATQWGYLGGLGAAPWTSVNDGTGSGLDADTVDGIEGAALLLADLSNATADLAIADGGTGSSTASGARTNLGVEIGSDVQAYSADLATIAGLGAADYVLTMNAGGTAVEWAAASGAASSLSATLAVGNTTGGTDVVLSTSDAIRGAPSAGTGATLFLHAGSSGNGSANVEINGGATTADSTAGGDVRLLGGVPTDGAGGEVWVYGGDGVGTNRDGGNVLIVGGNPTGTGAEGRVLLTSGGTSYPLTASGAGPPLTTTAQTVIEAINEIDAAYGSGDLLADGTVPLAANWDAGSYEIRAQTFQSDVTTGTAPLTVASTTLVSNLNADQLDGQEGSYYLAAANMTGAVDLTSQVSGDLPVSEGGTGASTASGARTNLSLVPGTDVQVHDADLAAIAGLTSAADRLPYYTGSGTAALATFSSFARSLVDDASASAARTTLGLAVVASTNDGRISASSSGPLAEASGASSIYYHRLAGDLVALYDGSSAWEYHTIDASAISVACSTGSASKPHDVFLYDSSGLTLELVAWTDDTTRATALAKQDGVRVKSGATARRYLGTVYLDGSKQVTFDDSERGLWNMDNRRQWSSQVNDATVSWVYTTATWREVRASANRVNLVVGVSDEDMVSASSVAVFSNASQNVGAGPGIGVDSTSSNSAHTRTGFANTGSIASYGFADWSGRLDAGRRYLAWLEISQASGTTTFFGAAGTSYEAGMIVHSWH